MVLGTVGERRFKTKITETQENTFEVVARNAIASGKMPLKLSQVNSYQELLNVTFILDKC